MQELSAHVRGFISKNPMHPVISNLIQLQELILIKKRKEVLKDLNSQKQLDANINAMLSRIPSDIRVLFENGSKSKRDNVMIVPVSNGACSGCGVSLPVGLDQSVKAAKIIQSCPNCFRILFYPESSPHYAGKVRPPSQIFIKGVSILSSESLMIPKLKSEHMNGVIHELTDKMESEGFVVRARKLAEIALQREALSTTAIDCGLAFPFARSVEGIGMTLALGIAKDGIEFDVNYGKSTRIVFFVIVPTAASAFYLKVLEGLNDIFVKIEAREAIIGNEKPKEVWDTLVKLTSKQFL